MSALIISDTHDVNSMHNLEEVYTLKDLKLSSQSLPVERLSIK